MQENAIATSTTAVVETNCMWFMEEKRVQRPRGSDRWRLSGGKKGYLTDTTLGFRRRCGMVTQARLCTSSVSQRTKYFVFTKLVDDVEFPEVRLYQLMLPIANNQKLGQTSSSLEAQDVVNTPKLCIHGQGVQT